MSLLKLNLRQLTRQHIRDNNDPIVPIGEAFAIPIEITALDINQESRRGIGLSVALTHPLVLLQINGLALQRRYS